MYLISGVLHSAHSEGKSVLLDENKKRKRKVYDCFYVQWRRKLIAGEKKESISQKQSHLGESKVDMTMGRVRRGGRVNERLERGEPGVAAKRAKSKSRASNPNVWII